MKSRYLLEFLALQGEAESVGDLSHDLLGGGCRCQHNGGTSVDGGLARGVYTSSLAIDSNLVEGHLPVCLRGHRNSGEVTRVLGAITATKGQLGVILSSRGNTAQVETELGGGYSSISHQVLEECGAVVLCDLPMPEMSVFFFFTRKEVENSTMVQIHTEVKAIPQIPSASISLKP